MVLRVGDTLEVSPAVGAKEAVQLQQLQLAVQGGAFGTGLVSGTVTPNADASTTRFNYTFTTDLGLAVPTGGTDGEQIELLFANTHGAGSSRMITFASTLMGGNDVPTSIMVPDGGIGYVRLRRSDLVSVRWIIERAYTASALTRMLDYVGCSGWMSGTTSVVNMIPKWLQPGDIVYAVVHSRASGTTLPAIANWASVYTAVIGGGTDADSTGPTRVTFLKRTVGAGGLTGTNTFSALGTTAVGAALHVFRPRYGATISEAGCFNARSTAAFQINGTTDIIAIQAGDFLLSCVGTPDDTANPISISGISVSGNASTFGDTEPRPEGSWSTQNGNDMSAATFVTEVLTGTSNLGLAYEGYADTSETGGIAAIRVRAA